LHRVAVLTALAAFPLVLVGAGVTSKDAGMAYPDWPTSAGHLVNPPNWWRIDATRWEHGHRLLGWAVGLLSIALAGLSMAFGGRRSIRTLGVCVLAAVIVQGVMGGLRVREVSTALAMVHGVWGQVCFCLACVAALVSGRAWRSRAAPRAAHGARFLRRLCLATTTALFAQLVLGAALRHFGAGAALVAHVLWAVVVLFLVGWVAMWVIGQFPSDPLLRRPALAVGVLMAVQLLLGGLAWVVTLGPRASVGAWGWIVPTLHVGVGALVLVSSVVLTLVVHAWVEPVEAASSPSTRPAVATA
jgi:cytochrome c oxidase assembly protein subunit 15